MMRRRRNVYLLHLLLSSSALVLLYQGRVTGLARAQPRGIITENYNRYNYNDNINDPDNNNNIFNKIRRVAALGSTVTFKVSGRERETR